MMDLTNEIHTGSAGSGVTNNAPILMWMTHGFDVRQLPDDLFNEILNVCVLEGGTSPWVLARVSHRFRTGIFKARKVWSAMEIIARDKRKPRYFYEDSRHYCTNVEALQYILQLSGRAPLDLIIRHTTPEIAKILAEEKERWDTLLYFDPQDEANRSVLFQPEPSTVMRKVLLSSRDWSEKLPVQWLEAVKPIDLEIRNHALSAMTGGRWWERLESLSFMAPWTPVGNLAAFSISAISQQTARQLADDILNILQIVHKRLKRLDLVNIPFSRDPDMQFPQLQELAVWNVQRWWTIQCPNLTTLKLGILDTEDLTEVTYPSVRELKVCATLPADTAMKIKLPNLEIFDLLDSLTRIFPVMGEWANVRTMRLHVQHLDHPQFGPTFTSFTRLEILEIYDATPVVPFFQRFEADSQSPLVCPALKRLLFDASQLKHKIAKEKFSKVFRTIVVSRRPSYPLESLKVLWPKRSGGGETEFVTTKGTDHYVK